MLYVWLAAAALAEPCPEVPAQVQLAWDAFNDAELEHAKEIISSTNESLACQSAIVPTEDLLALYRLDALVSLAQEDPKGAVYATLRAVAADHVKGAPPEEKYGPDLADLYRSWVDRMSGTLVAVRVDGGGFAWVDGRRADALNPLQVTEGEHLIQVEIPNLIRSDLVDVNADYTVYTGIPGPKLPIPVPVPDPDPVTPIPTPIPTPPGRRRPIPILVGGGVAAVLGGAALATAYRSELAFKANTYTAAKYDDCGRNQACYPQARADVINNDAVKIRVAYGAGYGLTSVGVGLLGVGAVGFPARTSGVTMGWRW